MKAKIYFEAVDMAMFYKDMAFRVRKGGGIKAAIRAACWGRATILNTSVKRCCPRWLVDFADFSAEKNDGEVIQVQEVEGNFNFDEREIAYLISLAEGEE